MKNEKDRHRWKILRMMFVCQLAFALVFQLIPPILSLIISYLEITRAQAGLLMSLFGIPGVFVSIPSGILSDRFGIRKIDTATLILMLIGTSIVGLMHVLSQFIRISLLLRSYVYRVQLFKSKA